MDAGDESLARWKASLGIVPGGTAGDTNLPKVPLLSNIEHRVALVFNAFPPGHRLDP